MDEIVLFIIIFVLLFVSIIFNNQKHLFNKASKLESCSTNKSNFINTSGQCEETIELKINYLLKKPYFEDYNHDNFNDLIVLNQMDGRFTGNIIYISMNAFFYGTF